jgi:excisionase family DNA binding protein
MAKHGDVLQLSKTQGQWESPANNSEITPILVSKRTAATALSVCLRTIDNLIAAKQLPCRRIGRRTLIPYASLVAFARRDHTGGAS